ncbi:hypothetical protein [Paraburkholderia aspalathi]|uniref:hypothetical protein n=1 Tax=Paraburkholderia aspalathi TaxID=1324617 RepID=UPI001B0E3987|nr:hypothetical protein [Paraburkholderia aspalathi]CAE6842172.1 hypothetical protein R20943_07164 [Paraburkholderia aspalathi]
MMKLEITITATRAAPDPGLPSHLFPGSGTDGAAFRVTSGAIPARQEIAELLGEAIVDAHLTDYNVETGEGYFVVVDGDAPEVGAVIDLRGESDGSHVEDQDRTPSEVVVYPAIGIEQFYDELDRHDWYCGFSDDWSVEKRGDENRKRLLGIANQHGQNYLALYEAFSQHYFSGEPWSSPKWDKPGRPVDGVLILPSEPVALDAAHVVDQQSEVTVSGEHDSDHDGYFGYRSAVAETGERPLLFEDVADSDLSVALFDGRVFSMEKVVSEEDEKKRLRVNKRVETGVVVAIVAVVVCIVTNPVMSLLARHTALGYAGVAVLLVAAALVVREARAVARSMVPSTPLRKIDL